MRTRTTAGAAALLAPVLVSSIGCGDGTPGDTWVAGPGRPCTAGGEAYPDGDGDGFAPSTSGAVECLGPGASPPEGYTGQLGDCDDTDPTVAALYQVDADGDDVPASVEPTLCGPADAVPEGAASPSSPWRGTADCDDSNPEVGWLLYPDADGDGVRGSTELTLCVPEGQGGVSSPYGLDCDDTDPTLARWARRDEDGDGYGGLEGECVPDSLPSGYAWEPDDCDDTRPDVHPHAVETWDDEADLDCDGRNDPGVDCGGQPCSELVSVRADCEQADLTVTAAINRTDPCLDGEWQLVVANRGTVAVQQFTLELQGPDGDLAFDLPDSLEPGAQKGYLVSAWLGEGTLLVSVSAGEMDCDPDNDRLQVEAEWPDRIVLCL